MKVILSPLALSSVILLLGTPGSKAAVTFDSFSGSTGSAFVTGPTAIIFPNESIAVQLRTDLQDWRIDDIDISWSAGLGLGSSPAQVEVVTGGSPYGGITTSIPLVGTNPPPANTTVNYTPSSTITLAPQTDFWIYLSVPTGDGDYGVAISDVSQASGPWTIQDVQARQSGLVITGLTNTPQIIINATPIPEPSSAFLGVLTLMLAVYQKRR